MCTILQSTQKWKTYGNREIKVRSYVNRIVISNALLLCLHNFFCSEFEKHKKINEHVDFRAFRTLVRIDFFRHKNTKHTHMYDV